MAESLLVRGVYQYEIILRLVSMFVHWELNRLIWEREMGDSFLVLEDHPTIKINYEIANIIIFVISLLFYVPRLRNHVHYVVLKAILPSRLTTTITPSNRLEWGRVKLHLNLRAYVLWNLRILVTFVAKLYERGHFVLVDNDELVDWDHWSKVGDAVIQEAG